MASQYAVSPEPPRFDELRAPPTVGLNVSPFKTSPIHERMRLQLGMDAQGVTNTPNFAAPGPNLSRPTTFGLINGAGGSPSLQGSMRVYF